MSKDSIGELEVINNMPTIPTNLDFDTNIFFSGGAGMFLQYHDVVKPVKLYAVLKMILTDTSFGLPINILGHMSILSIIEWYIRRRYKNPLQCLDYANKATPGQLDSILDNILHSDPSLYRLCPALNISRMMQVYHQQHMNFPIYIYSETEDPYIAKDCESLFNGIKVTYFFGDLKDALSKCDQNFTYIFSDIELLKSASDFLLGTYSNVLLTGEYRYNYIDNCKTLKYDLNDLATSHPFIRMGTTTAIDATELAVNFSKMMSQQGGDV